MVQQHLLLHLVPLMLAELPHTLGLTIQLQLDLVQVALEILIHFLESIQVHLL